MVGQRTLNPFIYVRIVVRQQGTVQLNKFMKSEKPPIDGGLKDNHSKMFYLKDGRALEYFEYGDRDGTPLVYCHGFPSTGMQASLVDDLAKEMHARVISPTRPGMGRSTYKPGRKILDFPRDLKELTDKLGVERFGVLGVSGGGPYALAAALELQDRVTVVGTASSVGRNTARLRQQLPLLFRAGFVASGTNIGSKSTVELVDRVFKAIGKSPVDFIIAREKDVDVPREEIERQTDDAFRQGAKGPAREAYLIANDWGFNPRAIKRPVHIWYGDNDKIVPGEAFEDFKRIFPKAKTEIYPGEGHFAVLKHMREVLSSLLAYN